MDDIVRLRPQSTYATVSAALALAKGQRVALVFPVGEHTCLHDTAALEVLGARCRNLGKVAIIIGGDAWLRARAVAAGFETATTLEDWGDTALDHPSIRVQNDRDVRPRLRLVIPRQDDPIAAYDDDNVGDTWESEPPDYVVALRRAYVSPSPIVRAPVVSGTLAHILLDKEEEEDDAISASERFEEMMIGRILETSGIHRPEMPGAL